MTEEAIDILLKVWTEESCSHAGQFWSFPELSLRPRIYQQPYPPLHMVASRPASAARVGARGWPVAMHFTPTVVVAQCIEIRRFPPLEILVTLAELLGVLLSLAVKNILQRTRTLIKCLGSGL